MQRLVILLFCAGLISAGPYQRTKSSHNITVKKHAEAETHQMVRFKDMKGRIIDGQQAVNGQFPWQVAIYIEAEDGLYFCGGAVINEQWVLTAAHCLVGATGADVLLGNVNLSNPEVLLGAILAFVNAGYSDEDVVDDVGVLQLEEQIPFGPNIQPISLSQSELADGVAVTVSGWGLTSDGASDVSQNLNYVSLVTVNSRTCGVYYGGPNVIPDVIVCAGGANNENICDGDSGGALVTGSGDSAVHVGIVNFGHIDGCEIGVPSGFTRTASYISWINSAIESSALKKH